MREKKEFRVIGSLMTRVSVVLLLIGLVGGLAMGIVHDFQLQAAHAHLNLVGGVLLFMFGLYYRLVPGAAESGLAKPQAWLHITGAILFPIGIVLVATEGEALVIVPIIGSLIVLAAVLLFPAIVFRTSKADNRRAPGHILRPIRGIVREADSPAPVCAQHMKNYA